MAEEPVGEAIVSAADAKTLAKGRPAGTSARVRPAQARYDAAEAREAAAAAVTTVESLPTDAIDPGALAGLMPSEPVCPSIPGLTFPELPDPAEFGKLIGDKLDSAADAISESFEDLQAKAKKLEDRIKNPPSPTDMMNEMASQVSSAADKAAKALEKGIIDMAAQVEANLAAEFDKVAGQFTDLEAAMEAVRSGAVDLGGLGMDILSLPGEALAGAFAGFKNAAECLTGEAGSAEAEFNKKAPELDAGVDEGRGQDGATAALAITETSKVVENAAGDKVSEQVPLTKEKVDELRAERQEKQPEKPITATPPPVPAEPIVTDRNVKDHAEKLASEGIPVPEDPERELKRKAKERSKQYYKKLRSPMQNRHNPKYPGSSLHLNSGPPIIAPGPEILTGGPEYDMLREEQIIMNREVQAILRGETTESLAAEALRDQLEDQEGLAVVE